VRVENLNGRREVKDSTVREATRGVKCSREGRLCLQWPPLTVARQVLGDRDGKGRYGPGKRTTPLAQLGNLNDMMSGKLDAWQLRGIAG
jgi:hypothetical protein